MLAVELHDAAGTPPVEAVLEVDDGRCLALTGPSGGGKTTILRMIAGLRRPRAGRVTLGGRTLFDRTAGVDLPPELRDCGFVFQDQALFPHLNVWRNVAFGLSGGRHERRAGALELLERLDVATLADARVQDLSGGERQRVALARALARRPSMLLLDEPLSALDVRSRAAAAAEISRLVEELAIPALLVTHDFFEASLLGSEIAVVEHGSVAQTGAASQLTAAPASAFVARLTGANVLHGTASPGVGGLTEVTLDGGGSLLSSDDDHGAVAVGIQPWEITLRRRGGDDGSARNALSGRITSLTPLGNRLRVALALPQPLVAEITAESAERLRLAVGDEVEAVFKAAATRLLPL